MTVALISGITGQDGSYLTEFLLSKGYEVHGIVRPHSTPCTERIDYLLNNPQYKNKLFIHIGDLADSSNLLALINKIRPQEVYNLAAQTHVKTSFELPEYTANITGVGTIRLLEAIHRAGLKCKFYQASTSELYGGFKETAPQDEKTPFHPRSPYAVAKLYSYWITVNYRESYNLFACNGILFNHESPRRGLDFVTRKITYGLARVMHGLQETISLGNLEARRDWGFTGDYIRGMWMILQNDKPGDYVLATGENHSVREFVELAFQEVGIKIEWKGSGIDEKGVCSKTGRVYVDIDPEYFRPAEVDFLLGNPSKAKKELGWKPEVSFKELVKMMVKADMELIEDGMKRQHK